MSRVLARKIGIFILSLAILFFISGCETVVAMKKGDVKMSDLVEITKLRNKPRLLASSVKAKDAQWPNIFDFSKVNFDFQKMDAWIQNKLW